jgi:hypothetical protein
MSQPPEPEDKRLYLKACYGSNCSDSFIKHNTFICPERESKTHEPNHLSAQPLHILENSLLELPLNFLSRFVRCRFAVEAKQSTQIELGRLEELDFTYVHLL